MEKVIENECVMSQNVASLELYYINVTNRWTLQAPGWAWW